MSLLQPPFLNPGDTIAIAAPARSVSPEQISAAAAFMESRGFRVLMEDELFLSEHQFGGSDAHRADYFNRLLARPDVRAIWCARGGYGSVRMVDGIDLSLLKADPKWIAGFSDITTLLCHIGKNAGVATLHASMPVFMHNREGGDLEDVNIAFDSLASALSGRFLSHDLQGKDTLNPAGFSGEITGGNLSVLYSLIDSASEPDLEGKILFLEDLDEYYYHIDRMVIALKRAGRLSKLRALLLGSFTSMHDHTVPFGKNVRDIFTEHCGGYGYPVVFDVDAGHHLRNRCIPFGVFAEFKDGILTFVRS